MISNELPTYPGDPEVLLVSKNTISLQGYNVLNICMGTHSGTHVDAPLHLIDKSAAINDISPEIFLGKAVFVEILKSKNEAVSLQELKEFEIEEDEIFIVRTGWEDNKYKESYFTDFPYFSKKSKSKKYNNFIIFNFPSVPFFILFAKNKIRFLYFFSFILAIILSIYASILL